VLKRAVLAAAAPLVQETRMSTEEEEEWRQCDEAIAKHQASQATTTTSLTPVVRAVEEESAAVTTRLEEESEDDVEIQSSSDESESSNDQLQTIQSKSYCLPEHIRFVSNKPGALQGALGVENEKPGGDSSESEDYDSDDEDQTGSDEEEDKVNTSVVKRGRFRFFRSRTPLLCLPRTRWQSQLPTSAATDNKHPKFGTLDPLSSVFFPQMGPRKRIKYKFA
jgi:hypothetical protein